MGKHLKLVLKIVGLELLIIVFFTINGVYTSITNPTNTLMEYIGLLPVVLGLWFYLMKTKKWADFFSNNRLILDKESIQLWSPLLIILAILLIGNGGIRISSVSELVMIAGTQILIVAFIEEMVFRGFMINILISKGFKLAVLTSSLLFALTHSLQLLGGQSIEVVIVQITYAFFIGMVLSLLIVNNQPIIITITFHGLNNFLIMTSRTDGSSIYNYLIISILVVHSLFLWSKAPHFNRLKTEKVRQPAV
ncbi:CPBP family intramembrane glutamic endopeptidase [Guptibacillus spartinae]|uniref:CPBP family intramembrane glutamic endopeptidase n=1 Tax=Guptibacillus spartinae TaxID=3025679 RepID=UPI00235F92DE|nr:CPBP family intramembrane glutamic endopeptidase [Pseudalkalibacillus spartinae]